MKRYIKLSLLLLLLIPLFVKNVYAEELIDFEIEDKNKIEIKETEFVEEVLSEDIEKTGTLDDIENEELEEYEFDSEEEASNEEANDKETVVDSVLENETSKEENKEVTLEEIIKSIDKEYSLDLEEVDNVKYENASKMSKVEEAITKIINTNLKEKNYNLEELGYTYKLSWNYLETGKASSYLLTIYDLEGNVLETLEINVTYKNSESRNEENQKKIDGFIEKNEMKSIKEYTLDEVLTALKENKNLIPSLEEYLREIFENSEIDFFIIGYEPKEYRITSNIRYEKVVLVIDGIIYKVITIENGYITNIDIPSEEYSNQYVENYIKEKLKEYGFITDTENVRYDEKNNEIFITLNNEEISLGKVKVNKIIKDYDYVEGANSKITPNNSLTVSIDGDLDELKRVEINSVEVNPTYYTISGNKIIISNEFIRALNLGTYRLEVIFKSGRAKTTFTILERVDSNTGNNSQNNNNNSGNSNSGSNNNSNRRPSTGNNYYQPTNSNNSYNNDNESNIENSNENNDEEVNGEETPEITENNEIDLDKILEVDKDNKKDNADKKDNKKDTEKKNSIIQIIKSRYVPIIIVVIAILVGGITAFIYLKSKEEEIDL